MKNLDVNDIATPENISLLFRLSMWWRILYGFLKLFVGISFLPLIGQPLSEPIASLMAHEITGPKGDAVLELFYNLFNTHDFTITYFIASYFIFWGVVDVVLSICLLRKVLIAFPVTMGCIALFICYGVFRFMHTHSLTLAIIILLDIAILFLINYEYKRVQKTTVKISTQPDLPARQI